MQIRTSLSILPLHPTAIMDGRSRGLTAMKARSTSAGEVLRSSLADWNASGIATDRAALRAKAK